jgi:hypothetical protein
MSPASRNMAQVKASKLMTSHSADQGL